MSKNSLRYMRSSYFETVISKWNIIPIKIHSAICGVVISRHVNCGTIEKSIHSLRYMRSSYFETTLFLIWQI